VAKPQNRRICLAILTDFFLDKVQEGRFLGRSFILYLFCSISSLYHDF